MKAYLQRCDKDNNVHNLAGELHCNDGQAFTFYLDTPAKNIVLNDGQPHDFTELEGVITRWWVDQEGFYLRGFLRINKKWHEEGLHLRFKPLPKN
jgi:hypothetical protein